ncbi:MAG: cysteine peptidase family C39 domain-containing protein [Sedimentisphaerales bacterium]
MNPWLETIGIILVALLGVFLGKVFSHPRKAYWIAGYFLSFLLIVFLLIITYSNSLAFAPPFVWVAAGRIKFVIFSLAVTMGLTTPLSRLPYKFEKVAIYILMVTVVVWFSVLPFLVPALIEGHLANLTTQIDSNGICFQTTDYTCAPAAAVTALRKLGLPAYEGEIAILSHTSPVAGTLPGCLQAALQNRYGDKGLRCQYRRFDSIAQLKDAGLTLAVVKSAFLSDHCVAVLDVSDRMVTVADPVLGKKSLSHKQFEEIWRFSGIVLKRDSTQSPVI